MADFKIHCINKAIIYLSLCLSMPVLSVVIKTENYGKETLNNHISMVESWVTSACESDFSHSEVQLELHIEFKADTWHVVLVLCFISILESISVCVFFLDSQDVGAGSLCVQCKRCCCLSPVQQGSRKEHWAETPNPGQEAGGLRCALTHVCCRENSKDAWAGCVRTESGS